MASKKEFLTTADWDGHVRELSNLRATIHAGFMELLATLLYLFLLTFPKKLLAIASLNLWRCPEFCEGLTRDAALCLEQGSRPRWASAV